MQTQESLQRVLAVFSRAALLSIHGLECQAQYAQVRAASSTKRAPDLTLREEVHPVASSCTCCGHPHHQLVRPLASVYGERFAALEKLPEQGSAMISSQRDCQL